MSIKGEAYALPFLILRFVLYLHKMSQRGVCRHSWLCYRVEFIMNMNWFIIRNYFSKNEFYRAFL